MLIYLYDGSFEGIMTAIYEAYYRRQKPDYIISKDNLQYGLMDEYVYIESDEEKSNRVYESAVQKIGKEAVENVFYVYLSEDKNSGTLIYRYLRLGFKLGNRIDMNLANEDVFNILKLVRQVSFEVHRFKGLLRFVELKNGVFYAVMEPDNNILMLLVPHFKERLSDQSWIIHDVKRGTAALYNKEEWVITVLPEGITLNLSEREEFFQSIWKEYFKTIAIEERKNPRLQKNYMPVRYWKNLIEKKL